MKLIMEGWLAFSGALFLLFRIWLAEIKLRDELQFRRHYLSRLVNIYFCIGWILEFENFIFNAIIVTCFPVFIVVTIWDSNFFLQFRKREYWSKNHGWLLMERLTLHPPMLIVGIIMYLNGITPYINKSGGFLPYFIGLCLVFIPFFILDERWTKKYKWPGGIIMLILMMGSSIVLILVIYVFL